MTAAVLVAKAVLAAAAVLRAVLAAAAVLMHVPSVPTSDNLHELAGK